MSGVLDGSHAVRISVHPAGVSKAHLALIRLYFGVLAFPSRRKAQEITSKACRVAAQRGGFLTTLHTKLTASKVQIRPGAVIAGFVTLLDF